MLWYKPNKQVVTKYFHSLHSDSCLMRRDPKISARFAFGGAIGSGAYFAIAPTTFLEWNDD